MGETASGSKDGNTLHSIVGSEGCIVLGFDGTPTAEGVEWLKSFDDYDSVEDWMKDHDAEGSKRVAKIVMKDTVITQIIQENCVPENECVGDSFDQEKDVLVKLVKLQTEAWEVLMPLYYENGDSCSTGGYSKRAESLLANNIPFFFHFLSELHGLFDIKSLWMRTSEKGTHDKHSDRFRKGATHRGILSINCHDKKMYFER